MREWRAKHPLNEVQKHKDNCRSYTTVLVKRGKLQRQPCAICRSEQAQAHHPDYDRPRLVIWLCRPHHLRLHRHLNGLIPSFP